VRIARAVVQDPKLGLAGEVAAAIRSAAVLADFGISRVAVAYATVHGIEHYGQIVFANNESLLKGKKKWLVSLDYGHTEPDALESLGALRSSKVRIPDATFVLSRKLLPLTSFHPKSYLFGDCDVAKRGAAYISGSANLTYGGLVTNVEHAVVLAAAPVSSRDSDVEQNHRALTSWFEQAWNLAEDLSPGMLRAYRALRRRSVPILADDEDLASSLVVDGKLELRSSEAARWAAARCFWIETGELYKNRGPGRSGNQLDCTRGTRAYFGFPATTVPPNTVLGQITLQYPGYPGQPRSVRFGDNMMDKINLPIPNEFGPPNYDNKVLHFERKDRRVYGLTEGTAQEIARWKRKSRTQGLHYRFSRGREYGFYS